MHTMWINSTISCFVAMLQLTTRLDPKKCCGSSSSSKNVDVRLSLEIIFLVSSSVEFKNTLENVAQRFRFDECHVLRTFIERDASVPSFNSSNVGPLLFALCLLSKCPFNRSLHRCRLSGSPIPPLFISSLILRAEFLLSYRVF